MNNARLPTALVVVATLLVFLVGCADSPAPTSLCRGENPTAPAWYCKVPGDPDTFYGASTSTSQDLQLAVDKAQMNARGEIARQQATKFEGLRESFREEVGLRENDLLLAQFTDASRSVVSQELRNTRVSKRLVRREKDGYRAFVLMKMPAQQSARQLLDAIAKKEELYTRFRKTEAFKRLKAAVEAYEKEQEEKMPNP